MTEYTHQQHEPDYDAALDAAAIALQLAGDVSEAGFTFAQRAQILDHVSHETTTPQKKQEVLDQIAIITDDETFLKASLAYARKRKRNAALKLSA